MPTGESTDSSRSSAFRSPNVIALERWLLTALAFLFLLGVVRCGWVSDDGFITSRTLGGPVAAQRDPRHLREPAELGPSRGVRDAG